MRYNKSHLYHMGTTLERKQTSFRLRTDLLERLQVVAKEENRSLNNFVESTLMDIIYRKPNAITLKAMREAESEEELETLDLKNFKDYVASL